MILNPKVLLAITELTVENQLAPRKEEFEITSKAKMKTTFFLVKKAISCLVAKPWRRANFQSLAITIVQVSVHLKNHKSVT